MLLIQKVGIFQMNQFVNLYINLINKGKKVSPEAKDLIKKLMTYDPVKRLSAKDALEHNWIKNAPENVISAELRKECSDKMKAFRVKNVFANAVFTFIISNLVDKKDK